MLLGWASAWQTSLTRVPSNAVVFFGATMMYAFAATVNHICLHQTRREPREGPGKQSRPPGKKILEFFFQNGTLWRTLYFWATAGPRGNLHPPYSHSRRTWRAQSPNVLSAFIPHSPVSTKKQSSLSRTYTWTKSSKPRNAKQYVTHKKVKTANRKLEITWTQSLQRHTKQF